MSYRSHGSFGYGATRKAQRLHARRSNRAKRIDESLRAPIAKTPEQWMNQPNRFDFPDVDTPNDRISKEEQDKRLAEINRLEANCMHSSRKRFRANLNTHRLCGVTH
jgi:hypothetical protein